jgi:hypothetical protein
VGNILVLNPLAPSAVAASRGTSPLNLLTPDPKEVWQDAAPTGAAVQLDIDLGAVVDWDTIFLGFTNAAVAATWSASYGAASYTTTNLFAATALRAADSIGPRHHAFYTGPVKNGRFIRLNVTQPAGSAALFAGVVMVGTGMRPTWNRDWGPSRGLLDMSNRTRLLGGGFGIAKGARKTTLQWILGELTDAEVRAYWALAKKVGESDPIVVCEDPEAVAGMNEGLVYGLFDRFEPYERQDPDQTKWGLSVEEWA